MQPNRVRAGPAAGGVFEVWVNLQAALLLSLAANLVTLNRLVTLDPVRIRADRCA